jgi:PST family polysaccharide transporter
MTTDSLGARGARGATFVLAGQLIRIVVLFASTVILSRLLAPDDFGLMAIGLSVLALGELIRDSGLALAVARAIPLSRGQKSNLFWINLGLGAITGLFTLLIAPLIAGVFGQPELSALLQWLSITLLLSGYATQFRAELNRNLQFLKLTIVDTAPVLVGLAVAIVWAVGDQTVWALAAQQLATAASGAVLATMLAGWLPGLPTREPVREFVSFGIGLLGAQLLAYGARNADNYLIGLAWGPTQLGYYSRAYQLLMAPMNQLLAPLTRVAVPVLSASRTEGEFNRRLLGAQLAAGAPLAVVYAACFGLAHPLVLLLLGPQWESAVPIFQALCIGGVFKAMNQATYWSFVATSRTKSLFHSYLVTQPLVILAMAAGLPWGAAGVAWGHSIGYAFAWLISTIWSARSTMLSARAVFSQALTVFGCFVIPVAALGWVSSQLAPTPPVHALVTIGSTIAWITLVWLAIPPARRSIHTAVTIGLMGIGRGSGTTS